jgi:hypothetical protein
LAGDELAGACTRAKPFHWQIALNANNIDPLAMRFEQLRDCFEKLQNNNFTGQLKEACDQQQEEKRVAKKRELQQEAENKSQNNNAATSNEKQPAKKLKVDRKWCGGCHTASHQGSQCWHEKGNESLQPAWLKKKKAAGGNSTATEANASNAIAKKHRKRKQKAENPPESSSDTSDDDAATCFASKFSECWSKCMWCVCHCSLVVVQASAQSS